MRISWLFKFWGFTEKVIRFWNTVTDWLMLLFATRVGDNLILRAYLHGGGGPQVGEVTRLAVVEK